MNPPPKVPPRPMPRAKWNQTPYAGSTAKDTDADIKRLLAKYQVTQTQVTEHPGANGRPSFTLRFILKGKCYRLSVETLHAEAKPEELFIQAKRVVYHFLKTCLEATNVFLPAEQALFAFLEIPGPDGVAVTMFEGAQPHLDKLVAGDLGRLMLPAPRRDADG